MGTSIVRYARNLVSRIYISIVKVNIRSRNIPDEFCSSSLIRELNFSCERNKEKNCFKYPIFHYSFTTRVIQKVLLWKASHVQEEDILHWFCVYIFYMLLWIHIWNFGGIEQISTLLFALKAASSSVIFEDEMDESVDIWCVFIQSMLRWTVCLQTGMWNTLLSIIHHYRLFWCGI